MPPPGENLTGQTSDAAGVRQKRRIPFRPDIEGIRAVALFFALLAHGGVTWISGGFVGVDMFFVISGYLITGLLVTEATRSGTVDLRRFYAHRLKRLLPLASLVLVVTVIGAVMLFPPTQREIVSGDVLAAALHYVNWHFAAQSVDYFGPETAASPIMHYWSLSIEEQFYLVWALVLLGLVMLARRTGWALKPLLTLVVAAIVVSSLIYSITFSAESPNEAYFSTFTRAWQIGAGALLALIPLPAVGVAGRRLLVAAGIGLIAWAVIALSPSTAYPGYAGLLPVLGTGALIVAGIGALDTWPQRILASRPLVYIGGLSYAWYLWHYPVMIYGIAAWGPLDVSQTTALVFLAGIPAVITHHLIGQPLRYSKSLTRLPRRAVAVGAACSAVAVSAAVALAFTIPSFDAADPDEVVGASVMKPPTLQLAAEKIAPEPSGKGSRADRGAIWDEGCLVEPQGTESGECVFGKPAGRRTVVLLGDSHAMHWFGALERLAKKRDWRLVALTKAGCPPFETTVYNGKVGREYEECRKWHSNVLERIEQHERPALIFTSASIRHKAMRDGRIIEGEDNTRELEGAYVRMLDRLTGTGAKVIALRDVPMAPHDMTDCVAENLKNLRKCAFREDSDGADSFDVRAAKKVSGVDLVDLRPAICNDGLCHGVIRDALVYRDNDHLTFTFARTLAPWLERELNRIED